MILTCRRNALPRESWLGELYDSAFPIQVDEDAQTVTVQGGVQTRVLLDFLATHMCATQLHDSQRINAPDLDRAVCLLKLHLVLKQSGEGLSIESLFRLCTLLTQHAPF